MLRTYLIKSLVLSKFPYLGLIPVDKFCEIQRYVNFSKHEE